MIGIGVEETGKANILQLLDFERKHLEALDDLATSCHKRYMVSTN